MIAAKLRAIPGVKLAEPQGAFYVLPEMSAFFGPGAEAKDFGPVPDSDTFCMYLMQKAHVSGGRRSRCSYAVPLHDRYYMGPVEDTAGLTRHPPL